MLSAEIAPDTTQQASPIYKELFESSDATRFVEDDEPLILSATDPYRYQTFAGLKHKVKSLATALRSEPFNLQEGDVVVVCIPDHVSILDLIVWQQRLILRHS